MVKRVYNNNVVLAVDSCGGELVLLGKGLGFQRRPGDLVDPEDGQRFVADEPYRATQVADILSASPQEEVDLAREIVHLAHSTLKLQPSQSLLLPVLDHLSFAVRRAKAGSRVDMPLRWEVAQLYPEEAALGRRIVALIDERLGVRLQEEEWVAFTLHLINQQWTRADFSKTLRMTTTIQQVFELMEGMWGRPIDQETMSSARFVTHLRYLFVRAEEGRQFQGGVNIDVMSPVRRTYPEAAEAALKIARLISNSVKRGLSSEEISYLALHTSRLYIEVSSQT